MFNFKKNILLSFLLLLLLLGITALTTFVVDPMQHYRRATLYKPYSFEQRYMVWGMLKNYEYDSILIGSSVTENFTKNQVDERLHLDILRVPFSGASAYEEHLILEEAFKSKKTKTILYGLDLFSFHGEKIRYRFGKDSIPDFLKNSSHLDDYKYLLNIDILFVDSMKIMLSNYFGQKEYKVDYNKFWNWHERKQVPKEKCIEAYNSLRAEDGLFKLDAMVESFQYNILPHIEKHPELKFVIFLPPYSILNWKLRQEEGNFEEMMKFKKHLLEKLVKYKNVKLYDFQDIKTLTHNPDNYIDPIHFSPKINAWIIEEISKEHYRIKEKNIELRIRHLKEQVNAFNYNLSSAL